MHANLRSFLAVVGGICVGLRFDNVWCGVAFVFTFTAVDRFFAGDEPTE